MSDTPKTPATPTTTTSTSSGMKAQESEFNPLKVELEELKTQYSELSETYSLAEVENMQLKSTNSELQAEVIKLHARKPSVGLDKLHRIEVALTRTSMDSQQRARVLEEMQAILNS